MEAIDIRDCPDKRRRADISNLFKTTGVVAKTAAYTMLPADAGKLFTHTGASGSVTLSFPGTLPIGWWCFVLHDANQTLVLAGSASGVLNGAASLTSDNTQDPTAFALVIKTSTLGFSVVLFGTWS